MDSFALMQSSHFSTTDRWTWCITALAFPMRISNWLFCLPSIVKKTPRYLNFSGCFSGTLSIWREHCFGCLDRHMVSVFVVLIFIPATEHASENLSRACWRPFWVESGNTRSSANNRRCAVHSPIFIPPQDSLFLTILSIYVRNRKVRESSLAVSDVPIPKFCPIPRPIPKKITNPIPIRFPIPISCNISA